MAGKTIPVPIYRSLYNEGLWSFRVTEATEKYPGRVILVPNDSRFFCRNSYLEINGTFCTATMAYGWADYGINGCSLGD